ncbi:hypothetical protein LINPERHAP1_LOCUS1148 [Linum perenne]
MRIQAELDIRKPLRREKKLRAEGGESLKCRFRYERLPNFCYICGRMGHIDRYCEVLFQVPEDKIVRLWSEEQRAPPRKPRVMPGEEWIDRTKSSQQDGRLSNPRGPVQLTPKPRNVECLLGNLGASKFTEDMIIPYGKSAVADEEDSLVVHDEKKRRRGEELKDPMEEDTTGANKPSKSPKKGSHGLKNVSQAGLPESRTCPQP